MAKEYASPRVVTLRNVLVLRESDDALLCQIEGHERLIPRDKLCDGSTIKRKGDTGTVVLPREFAVVWGLIPYDG